MTTQKTAEGPLSQYVKALRGQLKRPQDDFELPQLHFAKKLKHGAGRSPSSVNRLEQGLVRPSDDYLAEIQAAFPGVADLAKMLELRERQFGTEEEWSERRKLIGAAEGGGPAAGTVRTKREQITRPAAVAEAPASGVSGSSSALSTNGRERAGRPGTLRDRVARPQVTSPFGARSVALPNIPGIAPPSREVAPAHRPAATQRPAATVPVGAAAPAGERAGAPVGNARVVADIVPLVQSLSAAMPAGRGVRFVAAATVIAERLRPLWSGENGIGALHLRAAALGAASDLHELLVGQAPALDPADRAQLDEMRAIISVVPERNATLIEIREVLVSLLGGEEEVPDVEDRIDLLLLRALMLGARR